MKRTPALERILHVAAKILRVVGLAVLIACAIDSAYAISFTLTDLGKLPGSTSSKALDINASGNVVGYCTFPDNGEYPGGYHPYTPERYNRAFLWSADDGMTDLGLLDPHHYGSEARAISDAGHIVGISEFMEPVEMSPNFYFIRSLYYPFIIDADTWTMARLPIPIDEESFNSAAIPYSVNSSGHVVGSSPSGGFFYNGATVTYVSENGSARAISETGIVAGWENSSGDATAFVITEGVKRNIGHLTVSDPSTSLEAVNSKGNVVGKSSMGYMKGYHPFVYSATTGIVDLGAFADVNTSNNNTAYDININGWIIGWSGRPFLWTPEKGLLNLQALLDETGSGWILSEVTAINDNNQIVGMAKMPGSEDYHAVLLTPTLEIISPSGDVPPAISYQEVVSPSENSQLIIVTHGWTPPWTEEPSTAHGWVYELIDDIRNTVQNSDQWDIEPLWWRSESQHTSPEWALLAAGQQGRQLGRRIYENEYDFIHLIGHSAGARLMDEAAKEIRRLEDAEGRTPALIHLTFLDAYESWLSSDARRTYGESANWCDNYFAKDLTFYPTQGKLDHCHNVDVTRLDPEFSSGGSSSHGWPIIFYKQTILGTLSGSQGYGHPLAFEISGAFPPALALGNSPVKLGDTADEPSSLYVTTPSPSLTIRS